MKYSGCPETSVYIFTVYIYVCACIHIYIHIYIYIIINIIYVLRASQKNMFFASNTWSMLLEEHVRAARSVLQSGAKMFCVVGQHVLGGRMTCSGWSDEVLRVFE